jgi:hypothetical protein
VSQRLKSVTLTFDERGGVRLRVGYRTKNGPPPATARRRQAVTELARQGLADALKALARGEVALTGESGFEDRLDTLEVSGKRV